MTDSLIITTVIVPVKTCWYIEDKEVSILVIMCHLYHRMVAPTFSVSEYLE